MEWELPCADGSDRHCHKHVKVDIPLPEIVPTWVSLIDDADDPAMLQISPTQAWVAKYSSSLDEQQIAQFQQDGFFEQPLEKEVCAACGSDQSYDDEGNNITAQ